MILEGLPLYLLFRTLEPRSATKTPPAKFTEIRLRSDAFVGNHSREDICRNRTSNQLLGLNRCMLVCLSNKETIHGVGTCIHRQIADTPRPL